METSAILSLRPLGTDLVLQQLGDPDVAVILPYRSGVDPTPDIPACMRVVLLPLGGEADDQALQHGLRSIS